MSLTDEERALIQRCVIVEYASAFQKEDAKRDSVNSLSKSIIERTGHALEAELFRIRGELSKRKIKRVFVRKGEYRFDVRGMVVEGKMDGEMIKAKANSLLDELQK